MAGPHQGIRRREMLAASAGVEAAYARLAEELRIAMQLSDAADLDAVSRATLL
jgi:isopentenyl diphosphate isomerase/L-lactate dehydrogenase-like FMN-dependent dehydrogenase